MATIPVPFVAEISGTESVARKLNEVVQAPRNLTGVMEQVGRSVKEVGKDLDNLGLNAGKTFAMTAEGALSVVTALGAGGMAGIVGAVTVGVGYLAQAWANHNAELEAARKATEAARKAEDSRWLSFVDGARKAREAQKQKSVADLEDIANAKQLEVAYLQLRRLELKSLADVAKDGEEKARLRGEQAEVMVQLTKTESERVQAVKNAELASDQVAREKLLTWGKGKAERAAVEEKQRRDKANADFLKGQADLQKERERMDKEFDARQKAAEDGALAAQEAILRDRDAARDASEEKERQRAADNLRRYEDHLAAERQHARAVQESTAAEARQTAERERAIVTVTALNMASDAYGITISNTLTPAISALSDATRVLGEINWETYDQYRVTLKDIPPLMLQRAQAELFSMAITSAGAAAQKGAEAVGYLSTGAAMSATPGMQANAAGMYAAAAGAAVSSGMHASFAAAQGVAAVGAMGAGFALSGAGVAGFTQEDEDRRGGANQTGLPGLSRLTGQDSGGGGSVGGGGGGGMRGGGNTTIVLDYSGSLVLDPDDRRRAQRVWNEIQNENSRDGWGTL